MPSEACVPNDSLRSMVGLGVDTHVLNAWSAINIAEHSGQGRSVAEAERPVPQLQNTKDSINPWENMTLEHDDVIKWKHFPRNWPFVRKIHRSPVNFPHKGQWRGALMFSLIYVWINDWANNREAGDLRRQHGHYDVIVMKCLEYKSWTGPEHQTYHPTPLVVWHWKPMVYHICCLNKCRLDITLYSYPWTPVAVLSEISLWKPRVIVVTGGTGDCRHNQELS